MFKLAVSFAVLAVVFGANPYQPAYKPEVYADTKPYYAYNYAVKDDYSGNDFGQEEKRDGYETQGAYYVLLPDGRRQTVTYTANEYGYNADVQYDGYAKEYKPAAYTPKAKYAPAPYKAAPSYHAPAYVAPKAPVYHAAPSYHAPKYVAAPVYKPAYAPRHY